MLLYDLQGASNSETAAASATKSRLDARRKTAGEHLFALSFFQIVSSWQNGEVSAGLIAQLD